MIFFYGPLSQFDFNAMSPVCSFDLGFWPESDIEVMLYAILGFLTCWQIYEYYAENFAYIMFDFDGESLIKDLIKKYNFNYLDIVLTLFSLIFSCNILGLLPYTQTLTAQFICTLFLSLFTIMIIWVQSAYQLKIAIFNHFMPAGTPLILAPFIICIELISNLSRIISLAVRLFANISSGHALLKIIAGFALTLFNLAAVWKLLVVLPVVIILLITLLELLIAGLQTYVFITLILIYVSEFE